MSERKMSAKWFLSKLNTKAANSASGFLAQHREFLTTGELAPIGCPIFAKIDSGELMPTPALPMISRAVLDHMFEVERLKAEASIAKQIERAEAKAEAELEVEAGPKVVKHWTVTIYDACGNVCTKVNSDGDAEDLIKDFDLCQDGDRWAHRRLFDGACDWYAEVKHNSANVITIIPRDEAVSIIMAKKKGPVVRQPPKSGGSLSFRPKVKETRVTFSHG